jgi:(1->4)-alpha-D-glucan 1-alpha-D-glucosylmutase
MIVPRATYRLQLRNGMTFDGAAARVAYLARLGISHLYLSPIFEAAPGSTHGYDVVDCNRLDPVLGGERGFARLCEEVGRHGLALIVDFVPNHMAATPHNPWWRDVLEWGRDSAYAQHFDIDWSAPTLIVPVLARAYGELLAEGVFGLDLTRSSGELRLAYGDLKLPVTPPSYVMFLDRIAGDAFKELSGRFAAARPENTAALKAELARLAADPGTWPALEQETRALGVDRDALHALHERQVWRLTHWRAAREALTWRRFFEISDLVGLKVERADVFRDVHARLLELVGTGRITGIRLDHIDGLADPKDYLERLQAALGPRAPFYLVVEKILGPGENLPSEWPVAGTTGYEFAKAAADLLIDPGGETAMTEAYHGFLGQSVDYGALVLDAKRRILKRNLTGELIALVDMAHALAQRTLVVRYLGPDTLRLAIVELAAALTVYRTYIDRDGPGAMDRALIAAAIVRAKATREVEDEAAFDFLARLLLLEFASSEDQVAALAFTRRFQQTTGPVMAKALEDTAFYRFNRLVALNEVGGEPDHFGASPDAFHQAMLERMQRQPAGLSATSTHDTKRGEDARARLALLSELPSAWAQDVARWSALNAQPAASEDGQSYLDRESEWMFYQALLGAWPMGMDLADRLTLAGLAERMAQFMLKAVREAKDLTSWTAQNEAYEAAIDRFTRGVLDPDRSGPFLADFNAASQPLLLSGALNSLSQTLLKLVAPGIPDIYQGAEAWELSLVDPDNRRPIDFQRLASQLNETEAASQAALLAAWRSGLPKLHLVARGLALRSAQPHLFAQGAYVRLALSGPLASHGVAFARVHGDAAVVAILPRLAHALLDGAQAPHVPAARWRGTAVALPPVLAGRNWQDWLSGTSHRADDRINLETALAHFPVALLATPPP